MLGKLQTYKLQPTTFYEKGHCMYVIMSFWLMRMSVCLRQPCVYVCMSFWLMRVHHAVINVVYNVSASVSIFEDLCLTRGEVSLLNKNAGEGWF